MTLIDTNPRAWPGSPLPSWVTELRPAQVTAAEQIVALFRSGIDVVLLDAPVGSGKTLVTEMVRRGLGEPSGSYVCHTRDLQGQFLRDFPEARVLMGRSNYPTEKFPTYTAADCQLKGCSFCRTITTCPYNMERRAAETAPVAVLNTAYMLAFRGTTFIRDFNVMDEADTLEGEMMRSLEFYVGPRWLRMLDIEAPIKGARKTTITKWLQGPFDEACGAYLKHLTRQHDMSTVDRTRAKKRVQDMKDKAKVVAAQLEEGAWVRDYGYGRDDAAFILKPVTIHEQAADALWSRGQGRFGKEGERLPDARWLCMSGSFISPDEWVESCGVEEAGLTWDTVTIDMQFDKENRPIVPRYTASLSRADYDEGLPKMVDALAKIAAEHEGENILVHTVSFKLMQDLARGLRGAGVKFSTYEKGEDRNEVVARFKRDGGMILAPAMDRGLDLPDDLCRVIVVCKIPFPYLGDKQVGERLHMPGGDRWYAVQTARTIAQMTGRGVRHSDDWCKTYILDNGFAQWYRRWGKRLLPSWWSDAIVFDR